MVDLVEVQTAYYMIAATGVLIAAIYYVVNTRTTLQTRRAQFMMQLNESMTNVEVWRNHIELMNMAWTDLDDFEKKWGTGGNVEAAAKRFSLWWRLNFMGDLLRRNLVDREWLYKQFSSMVITQWFKWDQIIKQNRKFFNNPGAFADFQYLAEEMIKMDEQKGIKRRTTKTLTYEDSHIGKTEYRQTT